MKAIFFFLLFTFIFRNSKAINGNTYNSSKIVLSKSRQEPAEAPEEKEEEEEIERDEPIDFTTMTYETGLFSINS